ncbi:MAG: bifunctional phosphopantothenoylcysteine decarboxylase/phosphopantothenate--cysteine ligase CoaBC [Acidiferrobacterales bacterium]
MASLTNKRILLGLTGSIAAYKSADLARRLSAAGADVRVIMTRSAEDFITPLTMQAVSGHPVHRHLMDESTESGMSHIELARWADLMLVAPTSANFMAKLNQGRADDLLSTVCLATEAAIAIAPAMNQQMWANPATERNVFGLKQLGIHIFGPASGDQACGETGPGRMLEPTDIVAKVEALFTTGALQGLRIVITAGPTWEAIDPVRGVTNRSSGKMGYAIAHAAMEAGAHVTLISGPTSLASPDNVRRVDISSAEDMQKAVMKVIDDADIFIGVAAVADYRPVKPASNKLKKNTVTLTLELQRNPDILASVAARSNAPFTVGFAAETEDVLTNAQQKLIDKGIDLIAANQVGVRNSGFDADENDITLIDKDGSLDLGRKTKARLARELIQQIAKRFHAKNTIKDSRQTYR